MSKAQEVSNSNFEQEVLKADLPVLVDFWAPWCGPCKMMGPILDKVAEKVAGRVKIVKLNTDDNVEIAGQYQITGIPTLIVFKGGKEAERLVGVQPEAQLVSVLSNYS